MVMAKEANKILHGVTDSDLELIKHLCLPDKVVSQVLATSHVAVRRRISRVGIKLGVENRTAMIVKALKLDLITIDQLVYRDYGKANLLRTSN